MSESYEDLVKQLKPFTVNVNKLSDEQYSKLKVVDDPNRINDQPIADPIAGSSQDSGEAQEEEEEEIEIDLSEAERRVTTDKIEDLRQYICFFCKKNLNGYDETFNHYQLHIDYYPIQCSLCDDANPDVLTFIKHCRRTHPELEKARYVLKNNSVYYNWLNNFLTTEKIIGTHKYCPVCDWFNLIESEDSTPKAIAIIRHIHEHIQYMPFECKICRQNDREVRVHYLDYSVRSHITSEHKELEPPFWQHFNHRFSIPSLDKFIANYLNILGIKLPKKRSTRKRIKPTPAPDSAPALTNGQTSPPVVSPNSILTQQFQSIQPKPIFISNSLNSSPITYQNIRILPMNSNSNQVITYGKNNSVITFSSMPQTTIGTPKSIYNNNPLQMVDPLRVMPSNDKLNLAPIYVESANLGIVCVDPNIVEIDDKIFNYICVFCNEEKVFPSKVEACLHLSIHFSYYPIVCMLCEKTFLDLSTLIYHYIKSHEEYKNNLFHYLKEDQKIEKWMNGFIEFQKTHEFKANVSVAFGDYCFVCQKLAKNETSFQLNCNKTKIKVIRDHIHQHLHYFPFRCLVCFHGNRDVRFTSYNASAVKHLNTIHNINSNEIIKNLSKLIAKTDEILDLEKYIESKLFPKREKVTETAITLNLKRKLEEIEAETKKRLETSRFAATSSTPGLPSAKVEPMVRHEANKPPTISTNKPSNASHSLLRFSTTSSPQKFNGLTSYPRPIAPAPKPIEYIPNHSTYLEPYLLCFHCHQKVSNTKDLESHHLNTHPKLTIASYTPTKRDILTKF